MYLGYNIPMNIKSSRLVLLIVLLIIVIAAVFVFKNKKTDEIKPTQTANTITTVSLNSATVHVPELDVDVVLSQGQGEFPVLDTPVIGYVAIGKNIATEPPLALSTLAVNGGGSGIFEYLVLFRQSSGGVMEHTSSVFIGDRVEVTSITFVKNNNGQPTGAKVSYLDRSPDDAMAEAPTIPRTLEVSIKDSKFVK